MNEKKQMYLYLISHNKREIKTHTYIGCSKNFTKRLKQHNCLFPGGPRITRRASPNWRPVMILELPKKRDFSSKTLKKEWKSSSRGLDSRVRKGFQIAWKYNVKVYITKKNNTKVKLLDSLNKRWSKDYKIALTKKEWNKIIDGDDI
jgi:hypothetical protein